MRKFITLALCILSPLAVYALPPNNTSGFVVNPSTTAERSAAVTAVAAAQQESIRNVALREYAISKGIADGRRTRFQEIHNYFELNKRVLDVIYQVDHLYMQPRKRKVVANSAGERFEKYENDPAYNGFLIQPPIILVGNNIMQLAKDGQSKEGSSIRYSIAANAQFVSAPIYWQTFLIAPEDLLTQGPADDPLLQPRTDDEVQMMNTLYQVGMQEGQAQANTEVENRTKTLTTLIAGMNYGHALMQKGVMSEPEVTTQYVPVAGNKTQITLNTSVAQISNGSEFDLNPNNYKALVHQANPLEKR